MKSKKPAKKSEKERKKGFFARLFDRMDENLEKRSKEDCCCCSGKCSK